ncbi:MAG: PIN domain-containing protein [Candidatus Bathyarchaeota archaeon]|nr:PIN domain-containing protein [Candidatus Bathyarchaeota archaeon]
MAVFVDTGIFVALNNGVDNNHQRGRELFRQALKGDFGAVFTSDYIIDEAVTTAYARTKRKDLAIDLGKYIIESPRITKIWVTEDAFHQTWKKFRTLKDNSLSFTDCNSLALMETRGIKQIMSFDRGFDGLTQRIH